jgi:hypothetical protein
MKPRDQRGFARVFTPIQQLTAVAAALEARFRYLAHRFLAIFEALKRRGSTTGGFRIAAFGHFA